MAFRSQALAEGPRWMCTARHNETYPTACAPQKSFTHSGFNPLGYAAIINHFRGCKRSMWISPRVQQLLCPRQGQHCGALPQSLGLSGLQRFDGHIQSFLVMAFKAELRQRRVA